VEPLNFIATFFGVFAGLVVWNRAVRWGQSVWVVMRTKPESGDVASRSTGAILATLVLHSGPWLVGLAAFLAWSVLSKNHAPAWNWFFGGALAVPPIIALNVYFLVRRMRRAKAAGKV
jgi:hypothetical protein